jgi:hypothetical protein
LKLTHNSEVQAIEVERKEKKGSREDCNLPPIIQTVVATDKNKQQSSVIIKRVLKIDNINMSQCASPCCNRPASSQCSVCLKEWYCGSECQKADWKKHKLICKVLKRFSNQLQPYSQVYQVIMEIFGTPAATERVLKHLLTYATFQFGERIPGKGYRQRGNGERIDNFQVDINLMCNIYQSLINIYIDDASLSERDRNNNNLTLPCYEKMIEVLKP